jgi:hypothetical protein
MIWTGLIRLRRGTNSLVNLVMNILVLETLWVASYSGLSSMQLVKSDVLPFKFSTYEFD